MDIGKITQKIVALGKKKVRFIVLFGSYASGKQTPLSDIDIAVYYDGNKEERFKFRIKASGSLPDKVDLHVFQDLPVLIQKEVLSGKILYYKDYQFTFNEYMKVIKEFNLFEKYYNEYYQEALKRIEA